MAYFYCTIFTSDRIELNFDAFRQLNFVNITTLGILTHRSDSKNEIEFGQIKYPADENAFNTCISQCINLETLRANYDSSIYEIVASLPKLKILEIGPFYYSGQIFDVDRIHNEKLEYIIICAYNPYNFIPLLLSRYKISILNDNIDFDQSHLPKFDLSGFNYWQMTRPLPKSIMMLIATCIIADKIKMINRIKNDQMLVDYDSYNVGMQFKPMKENKYFKSALEILEK